MTSRHLEIYNFGPIEHAEIDLKRINVFIGPQSMGKSCLLKTACHCAWVEKRIMATHDFKTFSNDRYFFTQLLDFHKMNGFEHPNTKIVYSTRFLNFEYDNETGVFNCKLNNRYASSFKRSKLSYIPAERSLVAVVQNPMTLSVGNNNTASFITDWNSARRAYTDKDLPIMDIAASYHYDEINKKDLILVAGTDQPIPFTSASSGLQAIVPLLLYFTNLTSGKYDNETENSIRVAENNACLQRLYKLRMPKKESNTQYTLRIGQKLLYFNDAKSAEAFNTMYYNHVQYQYSDIYLEEPEENLFPQTQFRLLKQLVSMSNNQGRSHSLSIATHSPYVLCTINNMLKAGIVAAQSGNDLDEINNIVGKRCTIKPDEISAYSVLNGRVRSIIDEETQLVSADELDVASTEIEEEFDQLLDYENR